ncbi:hypothetical protein EIN_094000 [Entamoeba invadens IP1]|uniref:Sphingomyelin synthase-like domain-containing protein n=1 Tax=Entamoeba invadens IP1 TaxID=370355 RepID=A0A0A1U398_ENTIV|nr:hypothetical protein EIN_094000 [Entamoeba invadens IP1]ELP87223.1 hypothetical protein EIN_094000 [Entamoeba invadens IP1]|eukprot:XP_004253994.1 hypothetical protein EIN_094000 [Entamoeba invadens IP1]
MNVLTVMKNNSTPSIKALTLPMETELRDLPIVRPIQKNKPFKKEIVDYFKNNFLTTLIGSIKETFYFIKECFLTMYKKPSNGFKAIFTHPLLLSIVFMVSSGFLNALMIPFAQEFQRQWQRQHANIVLHQFVLDDVLFGIFPFVDLVAFADKYIGFFVVMSAVRFFMTPGRLVVLRRFTFLMGVNFFLRSVCLYFTLLSDPSRNISDVDGNPLLETFLVAGGIHISTVDKLFSGHTATLTLCGLFLLYYHETYPLFSSKKSSLLFGIIFKCLVCLYVCCGLCLFAAVRIHYTVDILVGALISFLGFSLYHTYILLAHTRDNSFNKFLTWFEADATDIPKIIFIQNEED